MRHLHVLTVLLATIVSLSSLVRADDADHRRLINASTTGVKGHIHVVITETIKSREQRDWKGAYSATVEVFKDGKSIGKFRGSTLPNFQPSSDKPSDWKYAVVQATCAFPSDLKNRYYTWSRTKRVDGVRSCLRLKKEVPTVNLSSARAAEMKLADILRMLSEESKSGRYMKYAEDILVHSGFKETWRGSAGCLTIHPDDADAFFNLIAEGIEGTLELNRGIEDESTMTSYCY